MKPIVTVTNIFPQVALDKLSSKYDLKMNRTSLTPEELKQKVLGSDAIISYLTDRIDQDIIARGTKLKIIANYGAGFNNVDVTYASERGIWVTNTPNVLHETTADLTWAMILGTARRVVTADRYVREGKFQGWGAKLFLGGDVYEKTLGIIGLGEIGRSVARRAIGFNMRTLYHQRNRLPKKEEQELNVEYVTFEKVLRESDFLTLHVPLTEATEYLIGNDEIALMKKTAYLIHTARGKVIDDYALVAALKEGRLAGAALDVYENEPEITEGMSELTNLMLLPHIGSASFETRDKMALLVADNIIDALSGKTPRSLVPGYPK
jgi:glyoxylate reductase